MFLLRNKKKMSLNYHQYPILSGALVCVGIQTELHQRLNDIYIINDNKKGIPMSHILIVAGETTL